MSENAAQHDLFSRRWVELIVEQVDFAGAYAALKGQEGFHAESLRGQVRRLQMRTAEAWDHFDRAEALYARSPKNQSTQSQYFLLKANEFDNATLEEALGVTGARRRTDQYAVEVVEFDVPQKRVLVELQITVGAFYNLMRGEFHSALQGLEAVLRSRRKAFEDQKVGFYFSASVAARELGLDELAEKYFDAAVFAVSMLTSPYKIALYVSRVSAVLAYWGREDEAREWRARLDAIHSPPDSKLFFAEHARIFCDASRRGVGVYVG